MSVSRNGGLVPLSAGDGLPALMRQTGKEVFSMQLEECMGWTLQMVTKAVAAMAQTQHSIT